MQATCLDRSDVNRHLTYEEKEDEEKERADPVEGAVAVEENQVEDFNHTHLDDEDDDDDDDQVEAPSRRMEKHSGCIIW